MSDYTDPNPFAVAKVQQNAPSIASQTQAVAAASRERAEIESAMVLAARNPRSEEQAYARLMQACERPGFAKDARYKFPRGGKDVIGPSVDLARGAARLWGNIMSGVRIVGEDDERVHLRGRAVDVQTNVWQELDDEFAKKIQRKVDGIPQWVTPDERDLRELVNRRGAILERNCILKLLPADLIEDAMAKAAETIDKGARHQLGVSRQEQIKRLVLAFDALGVSPQMLEQRLNHELSATTEKEISDLRMIYKSIADGNSDREEYFTFNRAGKPTSDKTKDLNDRIKGAATPLPAEDDPEMESEAEPDSEAPQTHEPEPEPEEDGEDAVTLLVKEKERRLRDEREAVVARTKLRQEQVAKRKLD